MDLGNVPAGVWIAEKQSLAEAIWKVLGLPIQAFRTHAVVGPHVFVWLDGHALALVSPDEYLGPDVPTRPNGRKVWRGRDYPVIPSDWKWEVSEHKAARMAKLKELLESARMVYHAGDPDTEGQIIVDQVLRFLGYTGPVRRVLVNNFNEAKVRAAVEGHRDNNEEIFRGWSRWADTRAKYDWLLGLNCTRAFTCRGQELGFDGLLPVGSVQTPLLFIVEQRDREIEGFTPVRVFGVKANFTTGESRFEASWKPAEADPRINQHGQLCDESVAKEIASRVVGNKARVASFSRELKAKNADITPSMIELQKEAFRRFKYSGEVVMAAAQKLYEVYKVMTYPRSDVRHLNEVDHLQAADVGRFILTIRDDLSPVFAGLDWARKSEAFNDKKVDGKAHHGIIPAISDRPVDISKWTIEERNVFDIVVRFYLAQFAAPYKYWQTKIALEVCGESFAAIGRVVQQKGWREVFTDSPDSDQARGGQELPTVENGELLGCVEAAVSSSLTEPPPRFDDGLLLDAMVNVYKYVPEGPARDRLREGECGIGTTATMHSIIQGLKDHNLLVAAPGGKSKLMSSPTARALLNALPMDVKHPGQAGLFKSALDRVASGEISADRYLASTSEWIRKVVALSRTLDMRLPLGEGAVQCPSCKAGRLKRKEGEHGAYWYCSNWTNEDKKCSAKYQDRLGKPITTTYVCPRCNAGNLRWKKGTAGAFWFCSNWNRTPGPCSAKFDDAAGKPSSTPQQEHKCPSCSKGSLRLVRHPKGPFWGCSRYTEGCKVTFKDVKGKPLTAVRR